MKGNSKIFLGLAIFLFCCAFSFKFTFGKNAYLEFLWADMITLMMGFLAAAVAMIVLTHNAKKEEGFDNDELELRELSERTAHKFDDDEFV